MMLDPFDQMRRHVAEMDRMMADPFGMMDRMMGGMLGAGHPMLADGRQRAPSSSSAQHPAYLQQQRRPTNALDLFGGFGMGGGFGLGGGLMQMMEQAQNDPNSIVFSQSTCVSMGPDGQQRVVQNSTRKAGDVKETRRAVRDGEEERVAIGHHIGERSHVIEKKRDRDGRIRQNQKYINLEEDDADQFNQEFKSRATRNLHFDPFARPNDRRALENGRPSAARPSASRHHRPAYEVESRHGRPGGSSAPIVEIPDDDDQDQNHYVPDNGARHQRRHDGPVIRELSEEEAEMENSKRRKGLFGNVFPH